MGVDPFSAFCRAEAGAIEEIKHVLLIDRGFYGCIGSGGLVMAAARRRR